MSEQKTIVERINDAVLGAGPFVAQALLAQRVGSQDAEKLLQIASQELNRRTQGFSPSAQAEVERGLQHYRDNCHRCAM